MYTNRVSFGSVDGTGAPTLTHVQNYYPFGLGAGDDTMNYNVSPKNLYKYEGKEWQPELSINNITLELGIYDTVIKVNEINFSGRQGFKSVFIKFRLLVE